MSRLFDIADRYLEESDWKTIAVLKFCLISLGILVGVKVAEKDKKRVAKCALAVFLVTYIPLMAKLFRVAVEEIDSQKH